MPEYEEGNYIIFAVEPLTSRETKLINPGVGTPFLVTICYPAYMCHRRASEDRKVGYCWVRHFSLLMSIKYTPETKFTICIL